ncbi:Hypothetical protein PHPALM_17819 [Phytophthora palmivora]|uniref:E3 ubiquitin-protein ligase n=1 Tax=Phytophthora palmivora TaxID=4796 RepID=A0A2P4XLA2_9STRA|nr:Hypothetical protein PHPALM_17819 [Phytophthora palmivora]
MLTTSRDEGNFENEAGNTTDPFSIEIWFSLAELGDTFLGGILLGAQDLPFQETSDASGWPYVHQQLLSIDPMGNLWCSFLDRPTPVCVARELSPNHWYHVVVTYGGDAGSDCATFARNDLPEQLLTVYLNGEQRISDTGPLLTDWEKLRHVNVGSGCISGLAPAKPEPHFSGWFGFSGLVFDMRVWRRKELSSAQVQLLFRGSSDFVDDPSYSLRRDLLGEAMDQSSDKTPRERSSSTRAPKLQGPPFAELVRRSMSTLPVVSEPTTLRRFLQTQSIANICEDMMPSLLAKLRHVPTPGDANDVNSVPLESVSAFLDAILLAHADRLMVQDNRHHMATLQSEGQLPPVTRDAFFERFKPKSSTQTLCGYLFQRNDIVFNCKTCQSDETCVLCLKCFQNGNHEGHDVFFHRTSPGGVCDCGDSEAWAPEGFCVYHGQRDGDAATANSDHHADSLPDEIVQVADALFTAIVDFCVEMAKRSMHVFDAECVDEQGRQILNELRRELQERGYPMDDAQVMERQFHVRICNDDVHSDEDLIRSLSQKRIPKAEDLVRAIDSNGSEIVAKKLTLRDALTLMQALKSEGWHVCVVQDKFIHDEDVLLRVTQWVKAICSLSKQLHVLFCDKLFATNGQSKEPIQVMFLSDPYFRKDIVLELYELYLKLQGDKDPKLQFSIVFLKVYNRISARQEKQHLTRLEHILDEVADEQVKRSVMMAPLGDGAGDDDSLGDGAMEPTKYILKKEYFKEYDPSFYHLSRSSHEKAQFARQEALFKTWKVEDPPVPLVTQVPPPHVSLGSVRFLVLEKGLLGVLRLILEDASCLTDGNCEGTSCTPGVKRTNVMVVLRAIHLINLAVLVLKRGAGGATLPQQNDVVLSESKRRQTLALLRNGPDAFEESDTASRGKKRVKRQPMSNDDGDVQMSSDSDQGDMSEVKDLSIVALLVTLSKDMLAALNRVIHAYVEVKVWSGMKKHEELVAENGMSKSELKKLHQQRAIAAMMARQKAFAQSNAFAEMDDEDQDDDDSGGSGSSGKFGMDSDEPNHELPGHTIIYRPPPPPDCIICSQKEKDEPIMYIGHAQMSRVNAHALENLPGDVETAIADGYNRVEDNNIPSSSPFGITKYFESVRAQSRFNLEHSQTNIAFDAHFGEFLCPLCQALSSMLVPCLPICSPLTLADQQRDRDAMERVFQSKQDTSIILSWLADGLPSRLETLAPQDECMSDDDDEDERTHLQRQDDVRAMNQFAVSFLEVLLRFQPEMTHLATAMTALKKGFLSTGPQLTHLI